VPNITPKKDIYRVKRGKRKPFVLLRGIDFGVFCA
jgi:Na+/melibiose symporter-like transporter